MAKKDIMILLSELKAVIAHQREKIEALESHPRQLLQELQIIDNFALVISGIRRCGKVPCCHNSSINKRLAIP